MAVQRKSQTKTPDHINYLAVPATDIRSHAAVSMLSRIYLQINWTAVVTVVVRPIITNCSINLRCSVIVFRDTRKNSSCSFTSSIPNQNIHVGGEYRETCSRTTHRTTKTKTKIENTNFHLNLKTQLCCNFGYIIWTTQTAQ